MQTLRTQITPLSFEDFDEIISMYGEPDSNKFIEPLLNKSDAFYRTFLTKKIEDNEKVHQFWVVRNKENNEFVGTLNLNQFSGTDLKHIGCHLARDYWNKGYATELMKRIIEYGFKERKLNAIHAVIEEGHDVSLRLFKNLGFELFEMRFVNGCHLHILKLSKKAT